MTEYKGVEVGIVWKRVAGKGDVRYKRGEATLKYYGKAVGFGKTELMDLDATDEECRRSMSSAVCRAAEDAREFIGLVVSYRARVVLQLDSFVREEWTLPRL
jgi:hypothetical protein